jgi:hypothetical protein
VPHLSGTRRENEANAPGNAQSQSDRDNDAADHASHAGSQGVPHIRLIAERVSSKWEAMQAHAESLDAKAGGVLGFAGS